MAEQGLEEDVEETLERGMKLERALPWEQEREWPWEQEKGTLVTQAGLEMLKPVQADLLRHPGVRAGPHRRPLEADGPAVRSSSEGESP
ncbi:hypothetical protein AOLI_G00288140 [Acnodon oligacanthus]